MFGDSVQTFSTDGGGATPIALNLQLNVKQRLQDLQAWKAAWQNEDEHLRHRLDALDPSRRMDVLRGSQIASLRRQLALQIIRRPIDVDPEQVQQVGLSRLRAHLIQQYRLLGMEERRLWLSNLFFVLTPTLRALIGKLDAIRRYRSFGQQRCFLLGGASGTGKSTVLNWYSVNHLPRVEQERNHVPVIKVDAPVSNRSPKPLFERMLLMCGALSLQGNEENYLQMLELFVQRCGVELLIVDEVEHITQPNIRRRLLELTNLTGLPITCASCDPIRWAEGDEEVQGRWNDYFELTPLVGPRLDAFLVLVECLLPFEQDSKLGLREIVLSNQTTAAGPAHYIEQWTDGVLREIMVLLADACVKALEAKAPCVTLDILQKSWRDIKCAKVMCVLDVLQKQKEGRHGYG